MSEIRFMCRLYRNGLFMGKLIILIFVVAILGFADNLLCDDSIRSNSLFAGVLQKTSNGEVEHLISYNFEDGVFVSADTVFTAPRYSEAGRFGFEFGENILFQERYVVTSFNNVIDIKEGVLIDFDEFFSVNADSLMHLLFNSYMRDKVLLGKFTELRYNHKGRNCGFEGYCFSEDHQWEIKRVKTEFFGKPILVNLAESDTVFFEITGSGTPQYSYSSQISAIPVHWIDKNSFLVAGFHKTSERREELLYKAVISKIDVTGKIEKVAEIDSIPRDAVNARFYLNPDETIMFFCGSGPFEIDLTKKQAKYCKYKPAGNKFHIQLDYEKESGRIIHYEDKEIGRKSCKFWNARTKPGFIGIITNEVGEKSAYKRSISVWNNITEEWTEIDVGWAVGILGWIENFK